MILSKHLPENAEYIRYIHPIYEHDDEDSSYCVNEDNCTDVWYDCIRKVNDNKVPIYYRRRTSEFARIDVTDAQYRVRDSNKWRNDFTDCILVRVKKIGRRVLFTYEPAYTYKLWVKDRVAKALYNKLSDSQLNKREISQEKRKRNKRTKHREMLELTSLSRRRRNGGLALSDTHIDELLQFCQPTEELTDNDFDIIEGEVAQEDDRMRQAYEEQMAQMINLRELQIRRDENE